MAEIETGAPEYQAVCVEEGQTKRWVISVVPEIPHQRTTDIPTIPRPRTPGQEVVRPGSPTWAPAGPRGTGARPAPTGRAPSHARPSSISAYVAAATAPRNHNKVLLVGGLLSLCVAGAGAAVVATSPAGAVAAGVTLYGTFRINPSTATGLANYTSLSNGTCIGAGVYQGLGTGATITIHNPAGQAVATGVLGASRLVTGGGCAFTWRIAKVPKESSYGIGIGQLSTVTFTRSAPQGGFNTAVGS